MTDIETTTDQPLHDDVILVGGRIPKHVPGAYPRLRCCGGPVKLTSADIKPVASGLTPTDAKHAEMEAASAARHGGRWLVSKLVRGAPSNIRVLRHLRETGTAEEIARYWAHSIAPAGDPDISGLALRHARNGGPDRFEGGVRNDPVLRLSQAQAILDWPIYRAAFRATVGEETFVEGSMSAANNAAANLRFQLPIIVGTALGKASRRYEEVFNDPSARGRFKEGMGIAESIYRKAINDAFRFDDEQLSTLTSAAGEARYADDAS